MRDCQKNSMAPARTARARPIQSSAGVAPGSGRCPVTPMRMASASIRPPARLQSAPRLGRNWSTSFTSVLRGPDEVMRGDPGNHQICSATPNAANTAPTIATLRPILGPYPAFRPIATAPRPRARWADSSHDRALGGRIPRTTARSVGGYLAQRRARWADISHDRALGGRIPRTTARSVGGFLAQRRARWGWVDARTPGQCGAPARGPGTTHVWWRVSARPRGQRRRSASRRP